MPGRRGGGGGGRGGGAGEGVRNISDWKREALEMFLCCVKLVEGHTFFFFCGGGESTDTYP